MRKKNNYKSDSKSGRRAGQDESQKRQQKAGGGEKDLLLKSGDVGDSLSSPEQQSWRGKTLDRSKRVDGSNTAGR